MSFGNSIPGKTLVYVINVLSISYYTGIFRWGQVYGVNYVCTCCRQPYAPWDISVLGTHQQLLLIKAKVSSPKHLPCQTTKAKRMWYHNYELWYRILLAFGARSGEKFWWFMHQRSCLFCRANCRSFQNLFGQRALIKYVEVLTYHFPCLYDLCSHCQQLKVKRLDSCLLFSACTAVRLNVI